MLECTVKRTHKFWLAFFLVAFVAQGVFLTSSLALADRWGGPADGTGNLQSGLLPGASTPVQEAAQNTNTQNTTQPEARTTSSTDSCFSDLIKCLLVRPLNGLNSALAYMAGGAAGLFVWMVQPENISGPTGIMNKASVYELWKFIRDFFNVFFILILLLSAFATVFQVENFSIRKIFLNILFAALIINFSFPITRFLIDLTNVPMYYFLNAILPGVDGGQAFAKTFLGSTGMAAIQIAPAPDLPRALINVVFTFLFTISLLVLGVLFLIRFIALTLLLIFSPIGFAASLMPGLQSKGAEWWQKFWQYALFGPSAALMLLVAMRFQNEIATDGTVSSFTRIQTAMSAGSNEASSLALVAFYTVPLILIWTAIGMANSSSIAGASLVTGLGYGAAKKVGGWGKKMVVGGTKAILPTNVAKGVATGVKDGLKGGKLFGLKVMPKGLTPKELKKKGEEREAYWKGVGSGGFAGGNKAKAELFDKRVTEKVKENKENQVPRSAMILGLDPAKNDLLTRTANALSLAQAGEIKSAEVLQKAIEAVGDNADAVDKILDGAKSDAFDGMDKQKYTQILSSSAFALRNNDGELIDKSGKVLSQGAKPVIDKNSDMYKALDGKMIKEGHLDVKIDFEVDQLTEELGGNRAAARQKVYDDNLKLKASELGAQSKLHQSTLGTTEDNMALRNYLEQMFKDEQYKIEVLKGMNNKDRQVWIVPKTKPGSGETVSSGGIVIPQEYNSKRPDNSR